MVTRHTENRTSRRPHRSSARARGLACLVVLAVAVPVSVPPGVEGAVAAAGWTPPPVHAGVDYQLGGDYRLPTGVSVVSRDWFSGRAATGDRYSICYVNAFQTQADDPDTVRPDERSAWPASIVLTSIGDDPNWPGEYLVDISTASRRRRAAAHVEQMVQTCADKGFDAVEYDNLDSWTRFDGTAQEGKVPFGKRQAIAYAELITDHAHSLGLAVGQKNTPQLGKRVSRTVIGFDFVVTEQCGQYRECGDYVAAFGRRIIDIEYTAVGFRRACASIGATASVVRRDLDLRTPSSSRYVFDLC